VSCAPIILREVNDGAGGRCCRHDGVLPVSTAHRGDIRCGGRPHGRTPAEGRRPTCLQHIALANGCSRNVVRAALLHNAGRVFCGSCLAIHTGLSRQQASAAVLVRNRRCSCAHRWRRSFQFFQVSLEVLAAARDCALEGGRGLGGVHELDASVRERPEP